MFPTFLRLLVIGLTSISFPLARAQSLDAFLENSTLKIGVNAGSYGGAIVWFSGSDGANLVNTFDKGREIQQSFYAGSSNTAPNQSPSWSPWPWNPIMVGDYADNVSPVLALNKSAGQIYAKTQPLLWDRNNQLSQSYMEQWISLHPTLPNVVTVDCRFTSFRDPNDEWGAPVLRDQELPALYFVSALNSIKAYTGNAPWTNGGLATIPNSPPSGTFPWSLYHPTEPWTACVNANGSGVGVYTPIATTFLAGKYGSGVTTNPFDISTMLQGGGASVSTMLEGFTPGAEYRLTFSAAQRAGYTGQTWNASIDGSVIGSFAPPNTARNHVDYTTTFTASAVNSLLEFAGTNLNGGDNTVFIDDVRVVQIAEAPTITLLSDNFNTVGVGNTAFNDITSLAVDQSGSLTPLAYTISSTGWDGYIQRGAGGRMLLAGYDFPAGGAFFNGQVFASLNHNFATAANALNARLQIQFNLSVTDSADPTNWGAVALGDSQNQSANNAAKKFASLFRDNGQTQQFASGSEVGPGLFTFTDGDLITLLLSDTAGTGSAFNGNGSVARLYVNGELNYSIWYSTDLAIWTEDTGAVEGTPALQGEVETVPVTLTGSLLTNPKLFIQVRAN